MATVAAPVRRSDLPDPIRLRFEAKFRWRGQHECWPWTASTVRGYGQFWVPALQDIVLAHRVAYALYVEDVARGEFILHSCDNPLCVNPRHLFVGTQADNMRDRGAKGRAPYGEDSGTARLTNAQVAAIKRALLFAKRGDQAKLAAKYGVSRPHITRIKQGIKRRLA